MIEPTPMMPRTGSGVRPNEIERDIRQVLSRHTPPPAREDNVRIDDLGRMSAEAVLTQYEAAAKAVEEMGNDVKTMVKRLGEALIECSTDMKHVAETAAAIREKGKHSQALIEQVSALSSEIRKTCDEFKIKVGL
jgi:hypothetical protein